MNIDRPEIDTLSLWQAIAQAAQTPDTREWFVWQLQYVQNVRRILAYQEEGQ